MKLIRSFTRWSSTSLFAAALILSAPFRGSAEDLVFAVVGDFGKWVHTNGVEAMIRGWQPKFIVTLGDNSYSDGNGSFASDVVTAFGDYIQKGEFYPCLGNHELHYKGSGIQDGRLDAYLEALKPPQDASQPGKGRYYDFAKGAVHFFVLNSNTEGPDSRRFSRAQGDWLREGLKKAKESFKVVCFHHPPYSLGSKGVDEGMQWPFKEWGASVVMSGHDHNYQVFVRRGLHYIVNGLGGAGTYEVRVKDKDSIPGVNFLIGYPKKGETSTVRHGAMRVTVNDQEMKLVMTTVRKVNGQWEQKEFAMVTILNKPPEAGVYRDLKNPSRGKDVEAWQDFLFEGKLLADLPDGSFRSKTETATRAYQTQCQIPITGILDAVTSAAAVKDGFIRVEKPD